MPTISPELKIIISVLAGITGIVFSILSAILAENFMYFFTKRGTKPAKRPWSVWVLYILSGLVMIIGPAIVSIAPSASTAPLQGLETIILGFLLAVILVYSFARQKVIGKKKIKYPRDSIVQIMNKKKSRDVWIAVIPSLIFLALSFLVKGLETADIFSARLIFCFIVILLLLGRLALQYRISQGWYGDNEREAREIIEFILKESSNIDFKDSGKLKKILSDEDLEEIKSAGLQPVPGVTD